MFLDILIRDNVDVDVVDVVVVVGEIGQKQSRQCVKNWNSSRNSRKS
jgi:hypothetical protein